jgi:hypothetical protein
MTTRIGIDLPPDLLEAARISQSINRNRLLGGESRNKTNTQIQQRISVLDDGLVEPWKSAVPEYKPPAIALSGGASQFSFCLFVEEVESIETVFNGISRFSVFPKRFPSIYPSVFYNLWYSSPPDPDQVTYQYDLQIDYIKNVNIAQSPKEAFFSFELDYTETSYRAGNSLEIPVHPSTGGILPSDEPLIRSGFTLWVIIGLHSNKEKSCFAYEMVDFLDGDYFLGDVYPNIDLGGNDIDSWILGNDFGFTANPSNLPPKLQEIESTGRRYARRRFQDNPRSSNEISKFFEITSFQALFTLSAGLYRLNSAQDKWILEPRLNNFYRKYTYFVTTKDYGPIV